MELILPTSLPITLGSIFMAVSILYGVIRAYTKLTANINNRFQHLEEKFDAMVKRNEKADFETEKVKDTQRVQETTIAVMAEQISNQGQTLLRIDSNVADLVKRSMGSGSN